MREGWEAAQRKPDSLTLQGHALMRNLAELISVN